MNVPDELLVVHFFLDDGNPGDHPMHIGMTLDIDEPPGTRPPPEPPPMTLMHPNYNDHVDDPLNLNSLFDGEPPCRVLPKSMIHPGHIDYDDILLYGETMDHINIDRNSNPVIQMDCPCLPITQTTKCWKCNCWCPSRRFVCTRVKMYNTPKWGGGGTCLTCEGTEE
jgi:hypothetical protein